MKKDKSLYLCTECEYSSPKWLGKCPACESWNTLVESSVSRGQARNPMSQGVALRSLCDVKEESHERTKSCFKEFDRVLGGGFVPGSLILIGGEPGIGKSTLLLKVITELSLKKKVLYVSGEESLGQIKSRAKRMKIEDSQMFLLHESRWETIKEIIQKNKIEFVVLDSIQTTISGDVDSLPGTASQIREVTYNLLNFCKPNGVTAIVVGHITKGGVIAGPKILEHMVDTVIYFEGDQIGNYRLLRAVKNRFGNTNEVGIFEMKSEGLVEVHEPTQIFLQEGIKKSYGRSLSCILEGTRTLFVEIQALVVENKYGNGRRTTQGFEGNRLSMIMAVIEKYLEIPLNFSDVYLNVVGGIKAQSCDTDLSVMASLLSSIKSKPIQSDTVFLGEVGLTGEIRTPHQIEMRLKEMSQLSYKKVISSPRVASLYNKKFPMEIIGLNHARDMVDLI
ncbi:MAG: DNA repair protein RadA [Bacteriovoracaceae bacterium]